MNADMIGWTLVISGAIGMFSAVQIIAILKNNHPDIYESLGKPGEHSLFEFHVIIDFFIFIIMRKLKKLKDHRLTNYADLMLLMITLGLLLAVVMLVSAN